MSLRNMNIAPRALLGFALIGLLMLGLGIFSLVQMGNIRQAGVAIEQVNVPSIKILDEITALNLRMRTLSYRLLINREPAIQAIPSTCWTSATARSTVRARPICR